MTVPISQEYAWVLFFAIIIVLFNLFLLVIVGKTRRRIFSKKFFATNFPELSERGAIAQGGYPDTGAGYYSQKLSHSEWVDFNNAQRVHYNYLEGIAMVLVLTLVAGLVFPRATVLCEVVYIVGRFLYSIGYVSRGPSGRLVGTILFDVALVVLLVLSLMSVINLGGGVAGFTALVTGNKN